MVIREARQYAVAIAALFTFSLSAHADTKRYMVTFKSPQTYTAVSAKAKADVAQGQKSSFGFMGSNAVVAQTFDNTQIVVVETADANSIASLQSHPSVASVEAEIFHPLPPPVGTYSAEMLKKKKPTPPSDKEEVVATKIDMPWGIKAVKAPEAWQQTKGNGIKVLVLDTGLDKDHPAIKSRLIEGKNFFKSTFPADDHEEVIGKKSVPYDYFDEIGHGTHVAGTILADGLNDGLVGVAPEAKLLAGRVCGEAGCSSIAIVAGIEWGIQQKVHVMSLSLGGPMTSSSEMRAFKAAEAAGITVVAASGNDGKPVVSYPAALPTVLAVGAVDSTLTKAKFSNWGPELGLVAPGVEVNSSVPVGSGRVAKTMVDMTGKGLTEVASAGFQGSPLLKKPVEGDLEYCGLGQLTDFKSCKVKGKVALIARGQIRFSDKVTNAIDAGAIAVVIFNNESGLFSGSLTEDGSEVAVPVVGIDQAPGEKMRDLLAKGETIKSTVTLEASDYSSYQGTSMACPHVSGVAALVIAANKSLTPAQVREVLKSTTTALSGYNGNEVGKGLVNAEAAIAKAKTMSGDKSIVLTAVGM